MEHSNEIDEEETIVFRMQTEIDGLKQLVREYHQYLLDIAPHSYLEGDKAKHLHEQRALLLGEKDSPTGSSHTYFRKRTDERKHS